MKETDKEKWEQTQKAANKFCTLKGIEPDHLFHDDDEGIWTLEDLMADFTEEETKEKDEEIEYLETFKRVCLSVGGIENKEIKDQADQIRELKETVEKLREYANAPVEDSDKGRWLQEHFQELSND